MMRITAFWKDRKKVLQKPGFWQLHFSFAATVSSLYTLGGSPDARWVALHAPDGGCFCIVLQVASKLMGAPRSQSFAVQGAGFVWFCDSKNRCNRKMGISNGKWALPVGRSSSRPNFLGCMLVFSILVDQNFPNWTLRTCCRWIALTSALVKASGFVMVCLKIGYPMPSAG